MLGLKLHQLGKAFVGPSTTRVFNGVLKGWVRAEIEQRALSRLAAPAERFEDLMRISAFGTRAASNECHRYGSRWLVRPSM
jgi:hypothetical protein